MLGDVGTHELAMIEVVSMMVEKLRRNPGCRCRRRDVDVGAEVVVTDKGHSNSETEQIK
jgi:Mn-containing catalase